MKLATSLEKSFWSIAFLRHCRLNMNVISERWKPYHKVTTTFAGELQWVADNVIASFQVNLYASKIRNTRKKLMSGSNLKGFINCSLQSTGAIVLTCRISGVIRHIKNSRVRTIPLQDYRLASVTENHSQFMKICRKSELFWTSQNCPPNAKPSIKCQKSPQVNVWANLYTKTFEMT